MSNFKINFGAKKGKQIFEKKFVPAPVVYEAEENIESDAITELTALQVAFRDKAKKEKELQDKNTSTEFWSQIIFKTQEQRDQFYDLLGVKDKDRQYINGQKLIELLQMQIATIEEKAPGKFRCNKEILELSIKPNF